MKKTVLILTECGPDIGFGHLARCSSISAALRKNGLTTRMMVASESPMTGMPKEAEYADWYSAPEQVAAAAKAAAFVVIDSYVASLLQIEFFQGLNPNIAVIDDYPRRAYRTGVVIDWTVGAEKFAFPVKSPGVIYILGCSYCALREEFETASAYPRNGVSLRALVTLGGSDIRSLTVPVASRMRSMDPKLCVDVVIGYGFRNVGAIEHLRDQQTSIHRGCSAKQMKGLMSQADFVICGGGQTLYEAASQGLPALVITLSDDQERDIAGFTMLGFCKFVGKWDSPYLMENLWHALEEIYTPMTRQQMSENGRRCIDGSGAARLVSALLHVFCSHPHPVLP